MRIEEPVFKDGYALMALNSIINNNNNKHEEADDHIMYHITHGVNVDRCSSVIVVSADTDVFVCLLYNFNHWVHSDIKELWMLCGQGTSTQAVPIHTLANVMDPDVVSVSPAVHASGGCGTTSKVGTKRASLKVAQECGFNKLFRFGVGELTEEMVSATESFLVNTPIWLRTLRPYEIS